MPTKIETQPGNVSVTRSAAKPKTIGTMPATPKEKPHVDETVAEKKARKARIISRRKGSKRAQT